MSTIPNPISPASKIITDAVIKLDVRPEASHVATDVAMRIEDHGYHKEFSPAAIAAGRLFAALLLTSTGIATDHEGQLASEKIAQVTGVEDGLAGIAAVYNRIYERRRLLVDQLFQRMGKRVEYLTPLDPDKMPAAPLPQGWINMPDRERKRLWDTCRR